MAKHSFNLKFLLLVIAAIALLVAAHNQMTRSFTNGWHYEQQFIDEYGTPKWEDCTYPNLEIETSCIAPRFLVTLCPWSNPEIFTRVVCLDTTTVGTWPEGYERCSVFGSVETIRLNDYPCDTERLAESFAAFPNLKTIEIHSGGSDFGDKLDRLLVERLPNVDVLRITMR